MTSSDKTSSPASGRPAVPAVTRTTVLEGLRDDLYEAVRANLVPGSPWTVIDYPRYYNCGDTAIWMGQRAVAKTLDCEVVRVLDRWTYRAERVASGSTVVLNGGGTFGGLYRTHHELRLRVLRDLRGFRILQMPQSVEFTGPAEIDELRVAIREHGDFVLLVRDERSFARAREMLDCDVILTPDAAFGMGPLDRRPASVPVAAQLRTDGESAGGNAFGSADVTFDWIAASWRDRCRWAKAGADGASKLWNTLPRSRVAARLWLESTERLSTANMTRAVGMVSTGQVLVTDRLHGHVIAGLAGVPHIVVNDRYGKVKALWDTWTHQLPGAHFAADWAEAEGLLPTLQAGR